MMKRIFTISVLMLAFVMNAVAWEPVIKEKHWFGMHEFYTAPLLGITSTDLSCYIHNAGFDDIKKIQRHKKIKISDNPEAYNEYDVEINVPNDWTESGSYFGGCGVGKIGSCQIDNNCHQEGSEASYTFTSITDGTHIDKESCIGLEARWQGSNMSFYQEISLPEGYYSLSFDVQNVNSTTIASTTNYIDDLFYVQVGNGQKNYENYANNQASWMKYNNNAWEAHTINFYTDGTQKVKISLGYAIKNNGQDGSNDFHMNNTPALFVSHLKLNVRDNNNDGIYDSDGISKIYWNGNNLESITVVKDWTSKTPPQQPKTSYYSWFNHQYRFYMNNTALWSINRSNNTDYRIYDDSRGGYIYGIGLYNKDQTAFKILDLKEGDQFCVEYYLDPNESNTSAFLANGNREMTATVQDRVTDQETGTNTIASSEFYTISSEGCVQIMMPAKTILRSVTIIHKNYQKATYQITEITDESNNKGYKYTLTGAGVLEDKRGAVPYITMRFGADNDMTFVKKLGDGNNAEFGAASIIDETNNFDPTTARLQSTYQSLYETEAEYRFAGKEWTVFSTDHETNGSDIFSTILPQYGTYYYFFPEVNGKLSLRFYCEGVQEHMPFWFKSKDGAVVDQLTGSLDTDGTYYYEYNNINVEKGGVYYLCSNPTIVQHELPIVRLISYEFIPTFHVEPLYDVIGNGSNGVSEIATIKGVTINEFTGMKSGDGYVLDNDAIITINGEDAPRVKFLGNIKDATISLTQQGDNIKLNFSNITYKDNVENVNQGGAIVVILDCPAGRATFVLTVAYDAAGKNPNGTAVSTQVKKWDFYSGVGDGTNGDWDLGKYGIVDDGDKILYETDKTAWEGRSKLFKEVNKADGLTADWVDTYVNLSDDNDERIFKSVYDMEGDNADMIHETAGLVFSTHANQLGIMNENNEPTTQFQDRYIGLMKGSKLRIPLLEAGDRIVLKMGTYNNENVTLGMTNAKDVSSEGITIGNNYIIGGSVPVGGDVKDAKGHVVPRGEYHIQAIANGDVDIEVVAGQLLKIYSIEIYRNATDNNADILTENKVKGTDENNTREILYTEADTNTKSIGLQLNYRGLNESTAPLNHVRMTGNIDEQNDITVTSSNNTHTYSTPKPTKATGAQFENGKFGAFKTRIAVKTLQGGAYVTDYADCMVPVGFREKLDYPNTWDFTDLREKYVTVKENNVVTNGIDDATGNEKPVADGDLKIWNNWSLTAAPENFDGNLFVSGGQLYAGSKMFDETRGLGIVHNGSNGILSLTATTESGEGESREGAISISDADSYGFIVPQVAAGQAVYVHATPISGQAQSAQFAIGEGSPQSFTYTNGNTFAMKLPADATDSDVRLCFQGYEVNKIAVATDEKTVNDEGWNTESRARTIDPSLLPYMTGKDFRTYAVFDNPSAVDGVNVINLTRIDGVTTGDDATGTGNKKIIDAAEDGSTNACIIRYVGDKGGENIFGDGKGFHLFVPDMHDDTPSDMSNNQLKAQLSATGDNKKVPRQSGDYFNYAFTNKFKYVDGDGEQLQGREGVYTGKQAFYLIMASGAASSGNQAYLSIESKVPAARLALFIEGEKDDSEATGIATVEEGNSIVGENARFYNLSGQQLSGKPNRSGLYIVNGKKVSIKNK